MRPCIPSISCYCNRTKYENAIRLEMGTGLILYYSYETVVGFTFDGETVVRENDWGATTGKHMAAIGVPASKRVPSEVFEDALAEALVAHSDEPTGMNL